MNTSAIKYRGNNGFYSDQCISVCHSVSGADNTSDTAAISVSD